MKIESITLRTVRLALKKPFETSFGRVVDRTCIITEIKSEGKTGWGEAPHLDYPLYTSEYLVAGRHFMENMLVPSVLGKDINHPDEVSRIFKPFKGNNISKSGIEMAIWDLFSKNAGIQLNRFAGAKRDTCEVGVSIGLQDSVDDLLKKTGMFLDLGYKRIKIKIKPGRDIQLVKAIRDKFPDLQLMVDANSAYSLNDIYHLKKLDEFNLMMIEQPLSENDIIDHATLQKEIKTPICLDESIHNTDDARKAIQLGSCRIINIKPPRVGGITETKKILEHCKKAGIDVWIGGMLETAIGKAFLDHSATFEGVTLPGDNSTSSRYFAEDIAKGHPFKDGVITVNESPGIGLDIDNIKLDEKTIEKKEFKA